MRDKILQQAKDGKIAVVDLINNVEGFEGNLSLAFNEPGQVMWVGVSAEAQQALQELHSEGKIDVESRALAFVLLEPTP